MEQSSCVKRTVNSLKQCSRAGSIYEVSKGHNNSCSSSHPSSNDGLVDWAESSMAAKPIIIERPGEHGRFSDAGSHFNDIPKFVSRSKKDVPIANDKVVDANKNTDTKLTIEESGEHGRFSDAGSYFNHVPKFLSRDSMAEPHSKKKIEDRSRTKLNKQRNLHNRNKNPHSKEEDAANEQREASLAADQDDLLDDFPCIRESDFPDVDEADRANLGCAPDSKSQSKCDDVKRGQVSVESNVSKEANNPSEQSETGRLIGEGARSHHIWHKALI